MKIIADKITITFKAGEALADGDVVYISAAGEVKKAVTANAPKVVGVADAAASAGADVDVVIYGKKTVTADGGIAVGDRLCAATTAGRVIADNKTTDDSAIPLGRILGKALGAAGAGDTLDILICLA